MRRAKPPVGALTAPPELEVLASAGAAGHLAFLNEVGGRLVGAIDLEEAASLVVELAVPTLADCAMLVLPDIRGRLEWWRWSGRGRCVRGRVRRPSADAAPRLSAVLTGSLLESDLSDEVVGLPRALAEPLARHHKVTALSLPAAESGLVRGALLLARSGSAIGVSRDVVEEFTVRASRAVSAAYRFERQKAANDELTAPLRPPVLPVVPGIRMAAIYRPSGGSLDVGGDFYDIHLQDDGSSLFMLGDVCGKGAEAAAMSGRVRQALAALRLVEGEPRRLLRLINQTLLGTGGAKFATIVVGLMARRGSGSLLIRVSSGGHPAPMVVRQDGVEVIAVPGMLVGIMPKAEFGESTVELAAQDTFVAYTDGITEARGGRDGEELFGSARLRAVLAGCAGAPVEQVVARVDETIQQWTDGQSRDDVALLAIQSAPGQ